MDPLAALDAMRSYLDHGGAVMVPLVAGTFVLWYAVGYRAFMLRRGTRQDLPGLLRSRRADLETPALGWLDHVVQASLGEVRRGGPALRLRLDALLDRTAEALGRGAVLARTIVAIAPLLGLLGTVTGMIEMFDSLGDQALHTQDGGIAGGIAEALFTTQLGLAIAIPGYFVTRVLDRREEALRGELEQLRGLIRLPEEAPA